MNDEVIASTRREIEAAVAAHDRARAVRSAREAVRAGSVTIDALYTRVLAPLLVELGTSWRAGRTAIWQEHLATSIVRTVVEALSTEVADAAALAPPTGMTLVLACPAGEQHDLGLRMVADRLALRGHDVVFLGADTPAPEVAAAARALGASVVALSAATHYNLVLLRSYVDEVRAALPDGVRVLVGGPALACDHCWPADEVFSDAEFGLDAPPPKAR